MAEGGGLRGRRSLSEIRAFLDQVDEVTYNDSIDINRENKWHLPDGGHLLCRKLVEVFSMEVFNLTEEDIEIYGTVEIVGGEYYSRFIYRRDRDDSVLVKKNGSAFLLLNGPKSVFGLDDADLLFCAYLRDKRDDSLIHVGVEGHPREFTETVMVRKLQQCPLSYGPIGAFPEPEDEESLRKMCSLKLLLNYIVYCDSVAAFLNVYYHGNGDQVHGSITAGCEIWSQYETFLFLRARSNPLPVACHGEILLSKQLVAVEITDTLIVDVALPGVADGVLKFHPKQHGVVDIKELGDVEVRITWKTSASNFIEAIEEGLVTPPCWSSNVVGDTTLASSKTERICGGCQRQINTAEEPFIFRWDKSWHDLCFELRPSNPIFFRKIVQAQEELKLLENQLVLWDPTEKVAQKQLEKKKITKPDGTPPKEENDSDDQKETDVFEAPVEKASLESPEVDDLKTKSSEVPEKPLFEELLEKNVELNLL